MPSAIDCYICHDSDGTYCLPKSYTTNGRFSGLINGKATESGPVPELFRSFDLVFCHKGETSWHKNQPRNSAPRQCG